MSGNRFPAGEVKAPKAVPSLLKGTLFDPNGWRPSWLHVPWDDWIMRLGKVEQIAATPCSPNPELWVQAGFRTLPHLLYSFKAKPFLVADAFKRFGMHHGRKHKFTIPQMSGLLAGSGGSAAEGGWAKFILPGDILLKLEWWFFIADVTTEGLLEWVSLAYEYEGCKYGENYVEADILEGFILGVEAGSEYLCFDWHETASQNYHAGGFILSAPATDDPMVMVTASQRDGPFGPQARNVSFRLIDLDSGDTLSGPIASTVDGGESKQVNLTYRPFGFTRTAKRYVLLCEKDEGFAFFTATARMYGHKSPKHGILMDP